LVGHSVGGAVQLLELSLFHKDSADSARLVEEKSQGRPMTG